MLFCANKVTLDRFIKMRQKVSIETIKWLKRCRMLRQKVSIETIKWLKRCRKMRPSFVVLLLLVLPLIEAGRDLEDEDVGTPRFGNIPPLDIR